MKGPTFEKDREETSESIDPVQAFNEELPEDFHPATEEEITVIQNGIKKGKNRHGYEPDIEGVDLEKIEIAYSKQGNFTNALVIDVENDVLFTGTAKRHPEEDPFIPERGKHIALTHLAMQAQAIQG